LPWSPQYTPTFRRDYKNLDQQNQRRVDTAITDILKAEDQRSLGRPKLGKWAGAFGYDVGRSIRILYSVKQQDRVVVFLRRGFHDIY